MWLGIDFGTTNTSAAVYDGRRLNYIPLDPLNSSAANLRSVIYINRVQQIQLGTAAVQTFLREDTGRPTLLEERVVGTIENTVASQSYYNPQGAGDPITIVYDVIIDEDVSLRGRLLQSIKTALRSAAYQGTSIFGKYYTVAELIALLLAHVRAQAERHLGEQLHQAVIGRPVTFAHDAVVDALAEDKIRQAAKLAGFSEVVFLPEPIAAAAYHANQARRAETVLVFDFGGGTLDLTILQIDARGQQHILASHGVLVGGDDLDSAIMRERVAAAFGAKSNIDTNYDGRPIPFPEHLAELLYQWQTIPSLTRPQALAVIHRARKYGDNPSAFAALETLATRNYGFALFQEIERVKCALSAEQSATLKLEMDAQQIAVELTRLEFNRLVNQERSLVREGLEAVVAASGLGREQIDVVVATGGSSAIPTFQAMLKAEFPNANLTAADLFGSVTGGLAIHAYELEQARAGGED